MKHYSTKMPPLQSYKRRRVACQHFPDDQTLRLQTGAGEDDIIHLPSGLDRVDCERQEEEEDEALLSSAWWGVTARSPTMVTIHVTGFVECRWWNDGWTVKTVVTWRSSASMIPAPGFDLNFSTWISVQVESYQRWDRLVWSQVSARTGWPGVGILWLGELTSIICSFYLSVAARQIVSADPSLIYWDI